MQTGVRVRLITRSTCSLCDTARETVAAVCADEGVAWEELDVDEDPALLAEHGEHVPVVLVDGQQVGFWRIPEKRLRLFVQGLR